MAELSTELTRNLIPKQDDSQDAPYPIYLPEQIQRNIL